MPFLPCRHPFECGRWFDISWSKPLSTRRTRLFDRNRGESSPFHSSRHPDNLPLTFLPNFSSFTLSLFFLYFHFLESFSSFSSFPISRRFFRARKIFNNKIYINIFNKFWINSGNSQSMIKIYSVSSFSSTLVSRFFPNFLLFPSLFISYLHSQNLDK